MTEKTASRCRHCLLKATVIVAVAIFHITSVSAQQYTFSLTTGRQYAPPSWPKSMARTTCGVDATASWAVFHPEEDRVPYRMGLKANFAYIPTGICGDRIGLGGFVTSPLCSIEPYIIGNRLLPADLSLEIGSGLGFYTKPWAFTHDPENEYISSPVNCVIDVGLVYTQPFEKIGSLVLGAKFVHNSNGFLMKPNKGLNFVQAEMGWKLPERLRPSGGASGEPSGRRSGSSISFTKRYAAHSGPFLSLSPGFCLPIDNRAGNGRYYFAYCIQLGYRFAYQQSREIGASVDFGYNYADNFSYRADGKELPLPFMVGLFGFHQTHWGPVSLKAGAGYYFVDEVGRPHLYERVGAFYHFGGNDTGAGGRLITARRQSVGIAIKAGNGRADFIEWTYSIDL